jgi:hypothetical protein
MLLNKKIESKQSVNTTLNYREFGELNYYNV